MSRDRLVNGEGLGYHATQHRAGETMEWSGEASMEEAAERRQEEVGRKGH